MTWYLWILAGTIGLLTLVTLISILSSIGISAVAAPDGCHIRTVFGARRFVPWKEMAEPLQLFRRPVNHLVIRLARPGFLSARTRYLLWLARIPDSNELIAELSRQKPLIEIDGLPALVRSIVQTRRTP